MRVGRESCIQLWLWRSTLAHTNNAAMHLYSYWMETGCWPSLIHKAFSTKMQICHAPTSGWSTTRLIQLQHFWTKPWLHHQCTDRPCSRVTESAVSLHRAPAFVCPRHRWGSSSGVLMSEKLLMTSARVGEGVSGASGADWSWSRRVLMSRFCHVRKVAEC